MTNRDVINGLTFGSGGSGNYVETITGTVANPWGSYTIQQLYDLEVAGAATVFMSVEVFAGVGQLRPIGLNRVSLYRIWTGGYIVSGSAEDFTGLFFALTIRYDLPDAITSGVYENYSNGTVTETVLTGDEVTTLTIIHHPMN